MLKVMPHGKRPFVQPDFELYRPPTVIDPPATDVLGDKPFALNYVERFADDEKLTVWPPQVGQFRGVMEPVLEGFTLSYASFRKKLNRRLDSLAQDPNILGSQKNDSNVSLPKMLAALGVTARVRMCRLFEFPFPTPLRASLHRLEEEGLTGLMWKIPERRVHFNPVIADITPTAALLQRSYMDGGLDMASLARETRGLAYNSLKGRKKQLIEKGLLGPNGLLTEKGREAAKRNGAFVENWVGVSL